MVLAYLQATRVEKREKNQQAPAWPISSLSQGQLPIDCETCSLSLLSDSQTCNRFCTGHMLLSSFIRTSSTKLKLLRPKGTCKVEIHKDPLWFSLSVVVLFFFSSPSASQPSPTWAEHHSHNPSNSIRHRIERENNDSFHGAEELLKTILQGIEIMSVFLDHAVPVCSCGGNRK